MAKSSLVPKNWPAHLPYLDTPTHSPTLNASHFSALRMPTKDSKCIPSNLSKGPSAPVKITPITTPSHPAHGQNGLFATKDLKPGTFILPYMGEIHASITVPASTGTLPTDPHGDSDYDLSLDREHGIGIDASRKGNEARFINDYRGIAERPNVEFMEIWDGRSGERGMGVFVLGEGKAGKVGKGRFRGVKKGEEILVSYGRGFWGARKAGDEMVE